MVKCSFVYSHTPMFCNKDLVLICKWSKYHFPVLWCKSKWSILYQQVLWWLACLICNHQCFICHLQANVEHLRNMLWSDLWMPHTACYLLQWNLMNLHHQNNTLCKLLLHQWFQNFIQNKVTLFHENISFDIHKILLHLLKKSLFCIGRFILLGHLSKQHVCNTPSFHLKDHVN